LKQSGAEISACASFYHHEATEFADLFSEKQMKPIAVCFSYEELANRDDVDVCYVGTINTAHFSSAMILLNAGKVKGVLIEKPIGVNCSEAATLIEKARAQSMFLMEGLWTRFLPAVVKAREIVASGRLGQVVAVHADFGFRCDDPPTSRMFNLDLAGGATLDIGIYPVSFSSLVFNSKAPLTVKASGTLHTITKADTSVGATMTFAGQDDDVPGLAVITYNLRGYSPVQGARGGGYLALKRKLSSENVSI
jgi:predicted dehydrogenase